MFERRIFKKYGGDDLGAYLKILHKLNNMNHGFIKRILHQNWIREKSMNNTANDVDL